MLWLKKTCMTPAIKATSATSEMCEVVTLFSFGLQPGIVHMVEMVLGPKIGVNPEPT